MKLGNHIANRFLTDDTLSEEIVLHTYPEFSVHTENSDELMMKVASLYDLLLPKKQTTYYITETVIEKLDLLKVKRKEDGVFDWSVFKNVQTRTITLIIPTGAVIRIAFYDDFIHFCHLSVTKQYNSRYGEVKWVLFFVSKLDNRLSENFNDQDVKEIDELIYKILCFMYLSENEEQIIPAGVRYGTKKSGKIVNDTSFPVVIVTSKWNITSIRTEGFTVSGHFRLQPYKTGHRMIFIEPFEKHGYTRHASNNLLN